MADAANVYLREVYETLPRLLASYDRDPLSPTLGLGDRLYWGWKTRDFANATPQGAANGLARLAVTGLLPANVAEAAIITRIDEMVMATRRITSRDGSLVEAFPNEKSFCVTALIAFDILCAAEQLEGKTGAARISAWRETAAPLIGFIVKHDETHAIISNHLATAVAALSRWTGAGAASAQDRAKSLVGVILDNQSKEGWYSEYGSADPGYETLGIYYLADAHLRQSGLELQSSLLRSIEFLSHFAHPDGSFGGIYGARNTRFIVPGGLEALAPTIPAAAALVHFMRKSISRRRVVTLASIDDSNLAPNFNAYCQAAVLAAGSAVEFGEQRQLPCEDPNPFRKHFEAARLIVDNGSDHYTVVAPSKGGVVVHCRKNGALARIDAGRSGRKAGRIYTTQALRPDNPYQVDGDRITVTAPFVESIAERPTPFKYLILRAMALSIFHLRPLTEFVKRMLVRRLITGQKLLGPSNRRTITLGPDVVISDETISPDGLEILKPVRPFTAIHMASAGYWQSGDDEAS